MEKPVFLYKIVLEKPEYTKTMFYRKIQEELYRYYADKDAPIVIVDGARQIGKSFIIRETASASFNNYIEINLKDDYDGRQLFSKIQTIDDFYFTVSSLYGERLGNIDGTIIFLDEIQVYPKLISMLKPLKQDRRYRYIASGSLLGITLKHIFIPMGSINEIKMYPMDFEEFLLANGTGKDVIDYLRRCFENKEPVSESVHSAMLRRFKEYLISGGLPDAIKAMVEEKNIARVRSVQTMTLNYYKDDASQYDEENNLHIRRIYDMLPSYMDNRTKRVILKNIENKDDTDLKKYQDEFDYLIYSGCALPNKAIANPKFPLDESQTKSLIKLYYNDVGILSDILYRNNVSAILDYDSNINLGSVYETVSAMELSAHGHELFYFDRKKVGEVDFIINDYDNLSVLPIEIKSGKNQNNYRALPKLVDAEREYNIKQGIVFGNKNIIETKGNITTYPIYMIMFA